MARHTLSTHPAARRALIALAAAGAALGAGAATASAHSVPAPDQRPLDAGGVDAQSGVRALTGSVGHATGTVAGLKPNPLAGTGVDPLDNGVGTQVGDFKPVGSRMLTGPVAQAESVGSVPVAGQALTAVGR
ncbi:hypothetical protein GCM10010503_03410 [Streptomyces lucensis JCM 4490]|uniref:ATP-binding protein n=1 Tax=Streptomyces lucensis JCM 4490 TaxID=1306176 RepID=A0A918IUR1_9ACTN|nr:hypothetical protein [Streptomyces lucensis]GGW31095.1 hypothetical protein GCM10010503_03410 [Streptomyces lucensis JCM 4490]